MSRSPSLMMFPGIGADEHLFEPQRRAFSQLVVPPWIAPQEDETLAGYALRYAQTMTAARPLVLGGISFGGMLAYEMAAHLRPEAVILIASSRTQQGISPMLRRFRRAVAKVPVGVVEGAKLLAPLTMVTFRFLSPTERQLCWTMFQRADSHFMRWAVSAILSWEPRPLEGVPVYHIHGGEDQVIPIQGVEPDEIVPDGGHLINLTHAQQVNAFIARSLERLQ
jgi:pimeloyl-ACP methyl ester carboxylesterase